MFCTYLTIYSGNKLPPFYIGYSTVEKVEHGYHGSVKSVEYQSIWQTELKQNPHLFKTIIITTHMIRSVANLKEIIFLRKLNVLNNPLYINKAIGKQCATVKQNKIRMLNNNPMKILRHNRGTFKRGHKALWLPKSIEKLRNSRKGSKNPNFNNSKAADHLHIKASCILCQKTTNIGNIIRWHKHELA